MLPWALRLKGPETTNQTAVTVRHCVYSFGGDYRCGDEKKIDVHVFNTVSLTWRKVTPETPSRSVQPSHCEVPFRCKGKTAVLIERIVYIWGGHYTCSFYKQQEFYNHLYAFDVDAHRWFKPQVSGTVPEGRRHHSACVLGKVMYIHGGLTQRRCTNDTYKLDTTMMVWSLMNARGTPPVSTHHSATVIGTKMYVFGGIGHQDNNIRVFDTETNLWLNTPGQHLPDRRSCHSAFAYNGELYILMFNDMRKFTPETFSWKKVEPKGEGPWARRCCCTVGYRVVLFGGDNRPDDLYVLDLRPSLKTLCKLAVIQYDLRTRGLRCDIKRELTAMTNIYK